jgi:diguanylate cyclase (GGDEF)-like protein
VAGFVVVTDAVDDGYLAALRRAGKPVVLISHEVVGLDVPVVAPDNRGGVREAVAHLYAHGHRRIAFAGHLAQADLRERYEAYREALGEHGLAATDDLFFETGDSMEPGGVRAGRAMLAAGLPSTAVVAGNDFNAVGIMKALRAAGHRLPQDQAIVGFDDSATAEHQRPALSSVDQRVEAVGAEGALLLLRAIAGDPVLPGRHLVESSFVGRESCGCPAGVAAGPRLSPELEPMARCSADQLARRLLHLVAGRTGQAGAADLAAACAVVGRLFARAALGDASRQGRELEETLAAIYAARPRKDTVASVLTAVQEAAASLRDGVTDAGLDIWVRHVTLALVDAWTDAQALTTSHLQVALRNEYDISMDLLRGHRHVPDALRWLAHSPVPAGCLALWADDAGADAGAQGRLEVVNCFGAQLDGSVVGATRVEPFPPAELIAIAGQVPGDLTFVLPVKTDKRSWGMLAMVGAAETWTASGRETYFQWAAILSVALDYQATVQSLRTTIAERAALEEQLRHQALYDTLTGLPNRTLFLDRLGRVVERARRRDTRFAVLFLDLDRFKVVNDSLGHLTGDLLLRQVAARITSRIRAADTAGRIGGDEFTVLLDDIDDLDAVRVIAQEIQDCISAPYELDGHTLVVTATIGVATSVRDYDRAEDVLRDADIAMYHAKSHERGSCAFFDTSMHEIAMTRLRTESQLRRAIDVGDLALVLPADGEPGHRSRRRARGARALVASRPRAGDAGGVLADRRGERPDRPAGPVARRPGVRAAAPVAGGRPGARNLADQPERLQQGVLAPRAAASSQRHAGCVRPGCRVAHDRDHRGRPDEQRRAGATEAAGLARTRCEPARGRLRHRLLVPRGAAPVLDRRTEDRPELRQPVGARPQEPRAGPHHHHNGRAPGPHGYRRGRRDQAAAGLPARSRLQLRAGVPVRARASPARGGGADRGGCRGVPMTA